MCRSERKWLPLLVFLFIFGPHVYGQTNVVSSLGVTTNFIAGTELTSDEVSLVLKLAANAGLSRPEEIETIRRYPGRSYGIIVSGENRQDGRKFRSVLVRVESKKLGGLHARTNSIRLEDFWVNPPYLWTNFEVSITLDGSTKRIRVSEEITPEIADTLIAGLPKAIAEFASSHTSDMLAQHAAARLDISQLGSISYDAKTKEYQIQTGSLRGFEIRCKLQVGRIMILSVFEYVV